MSIEGIFLTVVLAVISLAWVATPLLRRATERGGHEDATQKRRERLLVYYERAITNMRDLDEDRATGKIADDDYADERELWAQRGVQVLKALDELPAEAPSEQPVEPIDEATLDREIDAAIEAAVAAQRKK